MGEDGVDAVAFLMSANVGEALRPIQKIASGGELSRIMLALKNVLVEQDSVMTMVFDEVDTGVSGRAAQRVAEKLAKLSAHTASAVRDASAAARGDGRHALRRGKGRGKRPHAHKGRRARPRGAPRRDRPPKPGRPPERDDALRGRGAALRGGEL